MNLLLGFIDSSETFMLYCGGIYCTFNTYSPSSILRSTSTVRFPIHKVLFYFGHISGCFNVQSSRSVAMLGTSLLVSRLSLATAWKGGRLKLKYSRLPPKCSRLTLLNSMLNVLASGRVVGTLASGRSNFSNRHFDKE